LRFNLRLCPPDPRLWLGTWQRLPRMAATLSERSLAW
jgi:hypothetical protein